MTHNEVMADLTKALEDSFIQGAKDVTHLQCQQWEREGDLEMYDGLVMAQRQTARGHFSNFKEASGHFLALKVGECFKTGVSAYIRIR